MCLKLYSCYMVVDLETGILSGKAQGLMRNKVALKTHGNSENHMKPPQITNPRHLLQQPNNGMEFLLWNV